MLGIFRRGFDHYVKAAEKSLDRDDWDAASRLLINAIECDPEGIEKMEDLVWAQIGDNALYLPKLWIQMVNCLKLFAPSSYVGKAACAKLALWSGKLTEFEPLIEQTDQLARQLPAVTLADVSTVIYWLYWEYYNKVWKYLGADELREKARVTCKVSEYAAVLIQRIESANRITDLRPDQWEQYLHATKKWPNANGNQILAEQKLTQLSGKRQS